MNDKYGRIGSVNDMNDMNAANTPIVADLKTLVEIQSPSSDLESCHRVINAAAKIAQRLYGIPAKVIIENDRPIFWFGSDSPEVVLLGHLDTVWPKGSFTPLWDIQGDVIRGPGIFDMKAGFIQGLYAMKDLPLERIALIATSDEEVGSLASKEMIIRVASKAKAVLVLESAVDGKVKTGRKGTSMYKIIVHGRASHAGLEPELGINATTEIAHLILQIVKLENPEHGTTVVPTALTSGTTTNTVPAMAVLDVDSRSFLTSELERIDAEIKSLKPDNPKCRIEITGGINRPPLEQASTKALYEIFEKTVAKLGIERIECAVVGGASDGNFAAAAGAPTLDGLGAVGGGAHAANEWVQLSSIQPRTEILSAFIKDILND